MLDAPIVHQSILLIGEYRVVQPWPKIFTYLSCRNKLFQTCRNIGIQTLFPEVVGSTDDPLPDAGDTGSEIDALNDCLLQIGVAAVTAGNFAN